VIAAESPAIAAESQRNPEDTQAPDLTPHKKRITESSDPRSSASIRGKVFAFPIPLRFRCDPVAIPAISRLIPLRFRCDPAAIS